MGGTRARDAAPPAPPRAALRCHATPCAQALFSADKKGGVEADAAWRTVQVQQQAGARGGAAQPGNLAWGCETLDRSGLTETETRLRLETRDLRRVGFAGEVVGLRTTSRLMLTRVTSGRYDKGELRRDSPRMSRVLT